MEQFKLKLERPICFYDLETTGIKPSDRIVSITVLKVFPSGEKEVKSALVNPEMPIPKEASDVHGIHDADVADKPTFSKISKNLNKFIEGCDIGGFNNRQFDDIILCEEFGRANIVFPAVDVRSVDACTIFKKMEQRTLTAAYKFYCDKTLEDAHSSEADTLATYEVFLAQLQKYEELQGKTIDEISNFCKLDNRVDLAGKIIKNENGDYLYNFGKHQNQKVLENTSYANWMLDNDFSGNTKAVLRMILNK
jgi:DNA polymerase-3 subunit epsilon